MQPLNNDATSALRRAVHRRLASLQDGIDVSFVDLESWPWASVTFTGARHRLAVLLEGAGAAAAASRFIGELDEAEFRLNGHLLADIALVRRQDKADGGILITLEALTVEEA